MFSDSVPSHGLSIRGKEYISEAFFQGSDHLCIKSEAHGITL